MKGTFACLALLFFLSASARAQSTSPEELAFWQSVSATNDPVELHAYLAAYPTGAFVAIAKYRLQRRPSPSPSPVAIPAATSSPARLVPIRPSFRLVDGVTLDLDATALRSASNLRLTVVPSTAPIAVADPDRLASWIAPRSPRHAPAPDDPLRPPGTGRTSPLLYEDPNTGTAYVLAARAPVTIEAGVPGAMLVRDLGREAALLGPIHFEANHRDRPHAHPGRLPESASARGMECAVVHGSVKSSRASRQTLIMTIGQPNARADPSGSSWRGAVCVLSVSDAATLDRVSAPQGRRPGPRCGDADLLGERRAERPSGAGSLHHQVICRCNQRCQSILVWLTPVSRWWRLEPSTLDITAHHVNPAVFRITITLAQLSVQCRDCAITLPDTQARAERRFPHRTRFPEAINIALVDIQFQHARRRAAGSRFPA